MTVVRLTQAQIDEADRVASEAIGATPVPPATSSVRVSLAGWPGNKPRNPYQCAVRAHLGIKGNRAYELVVVEESVIQPMHSMNSVLPPLVGAEWTADTKHTAALEADIAALRRENEDLQAEVTRLRQNRALMEAAAKGAYREEKRKVQDLTRLLKTFFNYTSSDGTCAFCSADCWDNGRAPGCADRRRAEELTR